jgi:ribosomal protein S1
MKIVELKKKNNLLDLDLVRKKLARMETKQKLEEIIKRLKMSQPHFGQV